VLSVSNLPIGQLERWPIFIVVLFCLGSAFLPSTALAQIDSSWHESVRSGDYDAAVEHATNSSSALGRLISSAKAKQLSDAPMWHALLHYQSRFHSISSVKSQVDSPWFFQSERGKTDAEAELLATLAALFRTTGKAPLRLSPYCRFIARRAWLAEQLGDLFDAVPKQECPESDRYFEYLNAASLTLVFPGSHPNSPASAFGHTLLRIDQDGQSADEKLLNMSINYAAELPGQVSALSYVFGGIGGGFPGKYHLLPYHIKLREYRQIANRDTWEFPLKLSREQVRQVLAHNYEMLIAEFDYYFFMENCSYHLLGLLNVAFPDDPLTDHFSLWTIPVDTIKLLNDRNLLADDGFVASTVRSLREREKNLSGYERQLALQALNSGVSEIEQGLQNISQERQAAVLDVLSDYTRYTRLKDDQSPTGLSASERAVLSRRAKLPIKSVAPEVKAPDLAPHLGHETARLSISTSAFNSDNSRIELNYRPAYHDLRDPSRAYGTRSAIDFLSVSVARDSMDEKLFLSELTLFSIDSIEPRNQFFKPVSWRTRLGWQKSSAQSAYRLYTTGGAGLAYRLGGEHSPIGFAFLEGDALDDPDLPQRHALQVGTRAGMHWELLTRARFGVEWTHRELLGTRRFNSDIDLWGSVSLSRNSAVVLEASVRRISEAEQQQSFSAQWRWYL